jgi:hypothetical protein
LTLQLFLNDLSIPEEDCALQVAVDRLRRLVGTLRAASRVRSGFVLNTDRPFNDIALGANRPLAALRNDAAVTDERLYLKTVAARSPWTTALSLRQPDPAGGAEYRLPDDAPTRASANAVALGLAHDLAGLAISLPTHNHWDQLAIDVVRTTLDADAEPINQVVPARNASCRDHVQEHAPHLALAGTPTVHDGPDLWARRAELMPHLRFVPTARAPIEALPHGDPNLSGALERLIELDQAIAHWADDGSGHPVYPFNVAPESTNRLRKGLADINDADGVTRTFSDHARYGPDENRIHFILETTPERHALVGHVGRKLGIG